MEISHQLVHYPNVHNNQDWAKLKAEAHNLIQVSEMHDRAPDTWDTVFCFTKYMHIDGIQNQKQSKDSNPDTNFGIWIPQVVS